MNRFDWQALLEKPYSSFPEYEERPIIGITTNYEDCQSRLAEGYYKSVARVGGVPLLIPPITDLDVIINTLNHLDGLILSGGGDFNPLYCGEEPSPRLHSINGERDLPELLITRLAYNRHLPILGICKGIQTLVMALGGRVAQDIEEEFGQDGRKLIKHSQDAQKSEPTHSVDIEPCSILWNIYERDRIMVNSFHHQAIADVGDKFRVAAKAPDGVIEAIESCQYRNVIGVQWHPECLEDGDEIFKWLKTAASTYREIHTLHEWVTTLDSHCDTPMLFPQGVDISKRDPRILVDLHKMEEGLLDASIMVAYLPQPNGKESFEQLHGVAPRKYADNIFDRIEEMVGENPEYASIAKTPFEVLRAKQTERKAIMLGIENGLALEGDLANVEYFAKRGVVYITLCHNGDNLLCDSAKGSGTHNGLSAFGVEVIREMNKWGVMVDLSHASEKSFWDALKVSKTPIICSHSSCRALCDHPRNLTDEQMKALAERGGVMQLTAYKGFLSKEDDADLTDFLDHLAHAVEIMGVEHVGIGTDFDGDGGVPGLADASDIFNLIETLISEGYAYDEVEGIMGGNFLRLMDKVQKEREASLGND